jgi:glucosamine kinase
MKKILVADSGGSKTTWHFFDGKKGKQITTAGIAPYLITVEALDEIIGQVFKKLNSTNLPTEIFFYGTGCANIDNANKVKKSISKFYKGVKIKVDHDLNAVARSLCQNEKGIACILGTGSNSGVYNGKKITKNSPGTGYILGDEGSGAFLGKIVLQHYLYKTFDAELMKSFDNTFNTSRNEIYENTYRKPLANKYLASFAPFLYAHKGHYMIDNIIMDGLSEFFFMHLITYTEIWNYPIHFSGGIAFAFKEYLADLCTNYGFKMGKVVTEPIKGLVAYHKNN